MQKDHKDMREDGSEKLRSLSVQTAARGPQQGEDEPAPRRSDRRLRLQRVIAAVAGALCVALIGVSGYALAAGVEVSGPDSVGVDAPTSADAQAEEEQAPVSEQAAADEQAVEDDRSGSAAASSGNAESSDHADASASKGSSAAGGGVSSQGGSSDGDAPAAPKPDTVTVKVTVDSSAADGRVSGSWTLSFKEGATVYDALCGTGLSIGSSGTSMGVYVASIGGLSEKEFGGQSGWKYSVNGAVPGMACSSYVLKDGDAVRWFYVREA